MTSYTIDPYSSRTGIEYMMDRMQKEMEYKFRQMQEQQAYRNNQPMYMAQTDLNGVTHVYKNGIKQEETAEQKTAKDRAKKLRNLIAYYYSR